MGGIQLQSCTYELQGGGRGGTPPAPASAALDLTLWRGEGGGGLARVLVAVLPRPAAAAAALARLSLDGGSLGVGRCGGCAAQLAGLTALSLARCDAEPASGLAELLGELLPQAPGLRSLSLANYPGEGRVPAALLGLSGLQELTLQQLGLESLPPGAYLEGEQNPCCCSSCCGCCSFHSRSRHRHRPMRGCQLPKPQLRQAAPAQPGPAR